MDPTGSPVIQAKILIVEDDPLLRDLYRETLTDEGYTIDTAVDGNEGFTKIKQGGWDLILLDIVMPGMNGLDVIKKTKTDPPLVTNKKVIFLTNLDNAAEIEEAKTLGSGYIIKSQITPGDLVTQVKGFLTSS